RQLGARRNLTHTSTSVVMPDQDRAKPALLQWIDERITVERVLRQASAQSAFRCFRRGLPDPRLFGHGAADRDWHPRVAAVDDRLFRVLSVDADLESARRFQAGAGAGHLLAA